MPPQLWEMGWGGCVADGELFGRERGTGWSCEEVAAEGTGCSLVGLSSVISSGQRYTSMGPLVLFRWSWKFSWEDRVRLRGAPSRSPISHSITPNP